jgi:hypothetical protein
VSVPFYSKIENHLLPAKPEERNDEFRLRKHIQICALTEILNQSKSLKATYY